MSALEIRRQLRRERRRVAVMTAVLAVAVLVAMHHSGAPMDMHEHTGMVAVVQMCLGVFTAVGAALIAAAVALVALRRRRPVRPPVLRAAASALEPPLASVRHGPAAVSVLCVSRC